MTIENDTDYTLKGSQILSLRDYVLSATQLPGTVVGNGAPTTSVAGELGQLYYDMTNDGFYYCKEKTPLGTIPETYAYTWDELETGGGGGAKTGDGSPEGIVEGDFIGEVYVDLITDDVYIWGNNQWEKLVESKHNGTATVTYYSVASKGWTTGGGAMNCVVTNVDATTLEAFIQNNDIRMDPDLRAMGQEDPNNPGSIIWEFETNDFGRVEVADSDMVSTTGITVSLEDPGMPWAEFSLRNEVTVDTASEVYTGEVLDLSWLCGEEVLVERNNTREQILVQQLKTVQITSTNWILPDNFCDGATYLEVAIPLDMGDSSSYREIGNGVFRGCTALTTAPYLQKVSVIGDNFCLSCTNLTGVGYGTIGSHTVAAAMYIPDAETIGNGVFASCSKLALNFTFGAKLKSIGDNFMSSSCTSSSISATNRFINFDNSTKLETIGNNFFNDCSKFYFYMTVFDLKNVKTVGNNFMRNVGIAHSSFTCNIFAEHLERAGGEFMALADYTTHPLKAYLNFDLLREVGSSFLKGMSIEGYAQTSYSHSSNFRAIVFPSLEIVGSDFMSYITCGSSESITLSFPSLVLVGRNFLSYVRFSRYNTLSDVDFGTANPKFDFLGGNSDLSFSSSSLNNFVFNLYGTHALNLVYSLNVRTSTPWRHVSYGGSGFETEGMIIKSGAPTTNTIGRLGQLYYSTSDGHLYQCTAANVGGPYTWTQRW